MNIFKLLCNYWIKLWYSLFNHKSRPSASKQLQRSLCLHVLWAVKYWKIKQNYCEEIIGKNGRKQHWFFQENINNTMVVNWVSCEKKKKKKKRLVFLFGSGTEKNRSELKTTYPDTCSFHRNRLIWIPQTMHGLMIQRNVNETTS